MCIRDVCVHSEAIGLSMAEAECRCYRLYVEVCAHQDHCACRQRIEKQRCLVHSLLAFKEKLYRIVRHISKMKSFTNISFQRGSWFCTLCHCSLNISQFAVYQNITFDDKDKKTVLSNQQYQSKCAKSALWKHWWDKSQQNVCRVQWEKLSFPVHTTMRKLTEKLFCWVFVLLQPISLSGI